MDKKQTQHILLGAMVLTGTLVLIFGLYFIGSNQNLFGNNLHVMIDFKNVNGLMAGNNVRFSGIDIGTVERVDLHTDSSVRATLLIDKKSANYIRKNTVAMIGTDGLMGNKLVNLSSVSGFSEPVEDGDVLESINPIETDEMFRTLNRTNEDIGVIVNNLRNITDKVNSSNTIWSLLMDPEVAKNVKSAILKVQQSSEKAVNASTDLAQILNDIKTGKGTLGALITDPAMGQRIRSSIENLDKLSDSLVVVSGSLNQVSRDLNRKDNALGVLTKDTAFANNLQKSMKNLETGSKGFSENMEALKQSRLFKGYFKKQAKENQK